MYLFWRQQMAQLEDNLKVARRLQHFERARSLNIQIIQCRKEIMDALCTDAKLMK